MKGLWITNHLQPPPFTAPLALYTMCSLCSHHHYRLLLLHLHTHVLFMPSWGKPSYSHAVLQWTARSMTCFAMRHNKEIINNCTLMKKMEFDTMSKEQELCGWTAEYVCIGLFGLTEANCVNHDLKETNINENIWFVSVYSTCIDFQLFYIPTIVLRCWWRGVFYRSL